MTSISTFIDSCFEDQIRAEFSVLMQSIIQGDAEGGTKRFAAGVALAKQARDIASTILTDMEG